MLVTDLVNVRYLSGFTGSNAALLVFADDETPVLATDGRYRTQAAQQAPDAEVVIERACGPHLAGLRRPLRSAPARLREPRGDRRRIRGADARRRRDSANWCVRPGTVEALREVKDAGEIALLRLACEAADAALADLVDARRPAARPHREGGRARAGGADARPRRRRGVLRDDRRRRAPTRRSRITGPPTRCWPPATSSRSTSARWCAGYHSDMTRTFVLGAGRGVAARHLRPGRRRAAGRPRGAGARRGAQRGRRAHRGRSSPTPGTRENFGHGLGHGVGLQIHEAPGINAAAAGTLLAGSAVTVEPGVYLPDRGGVRIEDTLSWSARRTHDPELLTRFPKELVIL